MYGNVEHMTEVEIDKEIARLYVLLREKRITPEGAARLAELKRAKERIGFVRSGRVTW